MARSKPTTKSVYPKGIQKMITTAYKRKLNSTQAATRINSSKLASKLGVEYSHRQIATTFGNITRNRCGWYQG